MAEDNYVKREKYEGLEIVDGQLIPKRVDVKPEDLVTTDADPEAAHKNGGGSDEPKPRRRRRQVEED